MSIADGQVVLQKDADAAVGVDARLSISRVGSRAYPPALATLAPSIRLQLAQVAPLRFRLACWLLGGLPLGDLT